ncbi:MAG: glycosyltransferase [Candidatus Lokiarchaeota archaeon]|nr:glycosyltransferase [Candidatus Lokiarchaeota archaeon]
MIGGTVIKKKIGILSYRFPPLEGRDADFCLSFFKNLRRFDIDSYIITHKGFRNGTGNIKDISKKYIYRIRDSFIFNFLRRYAVFRELLRIILFPDQFASWIANAIIKGIHIIKEKKITHLFVMTPPASNLLIAYFFNLFTKVHLIIYIADLWTENPYLKLKRRYHFPIARRLEKSVLSKAKIILCASKKYIPILEKNSIDPHKCHFIPFGFDTRSFKNIKPMKLKKYTILHAGTIYPGKYVNPVHLFKAVRLLLDERADLQRHFQIVFCGKYPNYVEDLISRMGLENIVVLKGYLPKKRALKYILSSDLNLLLLYPRRGTEIIIPSKIYEYMKSGKKVLGLVPKNGISGKMINKHNLGRVIHPDNINEIKEYIINQIERYLKKKSDKKINKFDLDKFERFNITKKIVRLIENT